MQYGIYLCFALLQLLWFSLYLSGSPKPID